MSFTAAALIACAVTTVVLGFVLAGVVARLRVLESALEGGFDPTTGGQRSLAEWRAGFEMAQARRSIARSVGNGLVLALDRTDAAADDLIELVDNLPDDGRGMTLMFAGEAPDHRWPTQLVVREQTAAELHRAGVRTTPFALVALDRRIAATRPIGSPDALVRLLREMA